MNVNVGDRVLFRRLDGQEAWDTVRQLFMQNVLLEPYAPNEERPAAVLTEHSWCFLDDILGTEHSWCFLDDILGVVIVQEAP